MGEVPGQSLHMRPATVETADSRAGTGRAAGPWQMRLRTAPAGAALADAVAQAAAGDLPAGIERRLPRRAELLWNRLRGDAGLPPAEAAGALLGPPFATLALLVAQPARGGPQIAFAGSDIGLLGAATVGPMVADSRPGAPIPARLVALSLAAISARRPRHLDSDFDPDTAGPGPGILFRAVALPLAPDRSSGLRGLAVAVVSWRKLLSRHETDALHSELRAAMGWLASTGGPAPDR